MENEIRANRDEIKALGNGVARLEDVVRANEEENKRRAEDRTSFEQVVLEILSRERSGLSLEIAHNNGNEDMCEERKEGGGVWQSNSLKSSTSSTHEDDDLLSNLREEESKCDISLSGKFLKSLGALKNEGAMFPAQESDYDSCTD